MNAPAACILLLLCCFELSLGARHAGNDDAEGTALSAEGILSSRRSAAHHKITEAVSARDCNPDQLPRHLRDNASTEPSDFIVSVAFGYNPLQIRAFLTTFRRHNRDARIVVLVGPDQACSPRPPLLCGCAFLKGRRCICKLVVIEGRPGYCHSCMPASLFLRCHTFRTLQAMAQLREPLHTASH